ncbi:hypothetical protein MMPV_000473 [Pyropia vietnamensis]
MPRGAFILFEGGDRTGKTTQARRTVTALAAAGVAVHPPSPLRFPDRTTPVGRLLSTVLSNPLPAPPPPPPPPSSSSGSDVATAAAAPAVATGVAGVGTAGVSMAAGATTEAAAGADASEARRPPLPLPSAPPAVEAHALHLLFSANRWEAAPALVAALEAGETVVADRYALSGVAYTLAAAGESAAAAGGGGGEGAAGATASVLFTSAATVNAAWCLGADAGLPAPDLIIQLAVGAGGGGGGVAGRPGWGDELYETPSMQDRVGRVFDALRSGALGEVPVGGWGEWTVLDGEGDVDDVGGRVMDAVLTTVRRVRQEGPPLGRLWGAGRGA